MLRYTKDRPGLVALYDIQPGNGAGLFLQPGARMGCLTIKGFWLRWEEGSKAPSQPVFHSCPDSLSILLAIFQVHLGYPVPECLHSGFYCKAPVKSSPPTNSGIARL